MMLCRLNALLTSLVFACVLALPARAATQVAETLDHRPLYVWGPGESYRDGSHSDPRLDSAVSFWGAGIPLSQVFASVKDETGVEIGVFPPGDDNERICVNLYLNPTNPPTLRDLMAQLSWVTDCSFAYTQSADGELAYYLLSTTIGAGATKRIQQGLEAYSGALESGEHPDMQIAAQVRESMLARLPELRNALDLTPDQVIKRYKGKDDLVLLAALDPHRRAAAKLILSLSQEQLYLVRSGITINPRLSELTAEQRACVRDALEVNLDPWRKLVEEFPDDKRAKAHWDDWSWVIQTDPEVFIGTGDPTEFNLMLQDPASEGDGGFARRAISLTRFQLVVDPRWAPTMEPEAQVDLRRLLGDQVSDEQAQQINEAYNQQIEHARTRRRLQAAFEASGFLSAEAEAQLSSLSAPIGPEEARSLWQIEEAVASASGFSVISDCFAQPARSVEADLDTLWPNEHPGLTVLLLLKLMCLDRQRVPGLPVGDKGWEWGDAGTVLHFRGRERDAWRAAFLPKKVLAEINTWIEPYLPVVSASGAAAPGIRVPVDPRKCTWLLQQTTGPQRGWGGNIIYEDPTDVHGAYRTAFREKLLGMLSQIPHIYRLLGNLSQDQWQRLQTEGLTWGTDFSPSVTDEDREHGFWLDRQKGDVLRVVELEEGMLEAVREQEGPIDVRGVFVYRDGQPMAGDGILLTMYVQPKIIAGLVSH